jgi:predicted MFS family arabinose efflux permease
VEAWKGVTHRELLRDLVSSRLVLGLTLSFAVVTAAMGLLNASLPALFNVRFGEPAAYGYALAAIGAGLMCGEVLTGLVQAERIERRGVGVAFALSAASVFVLGHAASVATAYLMLFLLGMSDGATEVVRDTLFQRYVPRRLRAGTFAVSSSFQNAGMMVGLAAAPLFRAAASSMLALDVVAAACLVGAVLAGAALLGRVQRPQTVAAPSSAG